MPFQIRSLPKSTFEHLFPLADDELTSLSALRLTATKKPGFPCRISLADAEIGEEVILVHHEHQSASTPYRSSHAVFIRPSAVQCSPNAGEVPEMFRTRMLSVRAFDQAGMMIHADLAEGAVLEASIETMFEDPTVSYLHVHFAKPGCYAARVDRVLRDA